MSGREAREGCLGGALERADWEDWGLAHAGGFLDSFRKRAWILVIDVKHIEALCGATLETILCTKSVRSRLHRARRELIIRSVRVITLCHCLVCCGTHTCDFSPYPANVELLPSK